MTNLKVNSDRETAVKVLNANGIEVEDKQFSIEVFGDRHAMNPFTDWDTCMPLLYDDYGRRREDYEGIQAYLAHYRPDNLSVEEFGERIMSMYEVSEDRLYRYGKEAKDDGISDFLFEIFEERFSSMAYFCNEFGIKHYKTVSKGYSQGDKLKVLVVPTPDFCKRIGRDIETITEEEMKDTVDLFSAWAWGDVYGFGIKNEFGDVQDSCSGFYETNGMRELAEAMVDYIDYKHYGWEREELIELIENSEIKYY